MIILGYALAIVMGFTLGLLGGGGSILALPILVYVFAVDPVLATGYSLFIVGFSAVVGGWRKHMQGLVDWKTALIFATPSLIAVFLTRYYLVPAIPQHLFTIGSYTLTKDVALMTLFAIIMLFTAISMMRDEKQNSSKKDIHYNLPLISAEGLLVGTITGLVGAGGGFLIVPALSLWVGLPIKKAIGTSLVIIALKSIIGFVGDIGSGQPISWSFLLLFTGFAAIGMLIGIYTTRYVSGDKLKNIFGWFVLLMAGFIIYKELL